MEGTERDVVIANDWLPLKQHAQRHKIYFIDELRWTTIFERRDIARCSYLSLSCQAVRTLSSAFVILSCLLVVVAAAPPGSDLKATVHVGDGTLDGSFLKPYNNAWFYSVKTADGQVRPQGIWSDHMQWTTANGKQALLRVQGTTFVNGLSNTIINTFDPKTLAPITSEAHGIDGSIFKRTFDGAHVTSVTLANAKDTATPVASELPQAVYDFNGGLYGILLAALPLKAGLTGSIPAVADREDKLTVEPFHVLREEHVSAGAHGTVKAWVVENAKSDQYVMTFWLTKTAPYIVRLVMDDKVNKRVLTWDMI